MSETNAYIDESGLTSMEPEGPGHHPHAVRLFPDPASRERWENDLGGGPGGVEENPNPRGPLPVEGDGDGAPL